MATVALWHLGVTAVLAGALSSVILVQSMRDALRRLRRTAHRPTSAPAPMRPTVEPLTARVGVLATNDNARAMASAAGAR